MRKVILAAALFAAIAPAWAQETLAERQAAAQRQKEATAAIIAAEQARSAAVAAYPFRNPRGQE